jgi:hypothetical protein
VLLGNGECDWGTEVLEKWPWNWCWWWTIWTFVALNAKYCNYISIYMWIRSNQREYKVFFLGHCVNEAKKRYANSRRWQPSEIWRSVVSQKYINVSQVCTSSIIRAIALSQKDVTFILAAVRTWILPYDNRFKFLLTEIPVPTTVSTSTFTLVTLSSATRKKGK